MNKLITFLKKFTKENILKRLPFFWFKGVVTDYDS
uniref:Uncharacterized protein n=1 Tax=Siphoviridae sp. ctTnV63 TaxID=2825523 RepID=A0A8S5NUY2_9CAUD|nr:MAG TPA: hypothetical protein [Siphoviridae sp. ctTnV63]